MKKVIALVGPTGVGKTALSIKIAQQYGCEIISADSMQVYKNMPIATAVATQHEQDGVKHHLTEFLNVNESFSVAEFVRLAKEAISDITARDKLPLVVGGTGLFVDSLFANLQFVDSGGSSVRQALRERLAADGAAALYNELCQIDPAAAEKIHPNNTKRVLRALELYYETGTTISQQLEQSRAVPSDLDVLFLGLNFAQRSKLYDRINKRVDLMVESGLLDEAQLFLNLGTDATARQAIGHKELAPYLRGEVPLDTALDSLKRETRRYAKRQLTWFRRNEKINWFYVDDYDGFDSMKNDVFKFCESFLGSDSN